MKNETTIEGVQEILGKPIGLEYDNKTQKIRLSLLFISLLNLIYIFANLKLSPSSTFFGLKFDNLTQDKLNVIVLIITFYYLAEFIWRSHDKFVEWRLRITGTSTAFMPNGGFPSNHSDKADDPRQSTLYNWWRTRIRVHRNIEEYQQSTKAQLDEILKIISSSTGTFTGIEPKLDSVLGHVSQLSTELKQSQDVLQDHRIPASLERFDSWFKYFIKTQNLRWFCLEFLLPVLLGFASVIGIIYQLMCNNA
jgi:hypothetical protein